MILISVQLRTTLVYTRKKNECTLLKRTLQNSPTMYYLISAGICKVPGTTEEKALEIFYESESEGKTSIVGIISIKITCRSRLRALHDTRSSDATEVHVVWQIVLIIAVRYTLKALIVK